MATDKARYTVSVDRDLFQRIEDFRFKYRYQTRSEATVELIRLGLASFKQNEENKPDIQEIDTEILDGLKISYVDNMKEVLHEALAK